MHKGTSLRKGIHITKEEALQRITDYEAVAMDGSREQLQDTLETTTRALYMIVDRIKDENELNGVLDVVEQIMTPLYYD